MKRRASRAAAPATALTDLEEAFPHAIVISRWLLVLAVTALVVFGSPRQPALLPDFAVILAMVLSNVVIAWGRTRGPGWKQAIELATVADVLVVTLVIGWIDPSPETYLAVFAALILASALGRIGLVMLMMLLVCGVYAGYLYTDIGADFWRQVPLIVRIPFLFAIGLHFASIAAYLKIEKTRSQDLILTARQHAERADYLAREQDRLRALSEIGRLGLTAADAHPVKVLLEIANRAKAALNASRCALILFARDDSPQAWAGRNKDRSIEVQTLPIGPRALATILPDGKLAELHPGETKETLAKFKVFFPDSNPFGSVLAAPVTGDDRVVGVMFLIDRDAQRKYADAERDFFWTASLMAGAFIRARERLENEVRLRTLITNAPVIMFALGSDGTIQLLEGRGTAALQRSAADLVGESLFDLVANPEEIREAFEAAAAGRMVTGTLAIDDMYFETQYSPLRSVNGEISGVMGVTTAVLDAPQPSATPATTTPDPTPAPPSRSVVDPSTPQPPEPKIPLADEAPPRPPLTPKIPLADEAPPRPPLTPKIPLADEAPPRPPLTPKIPLADEAPPRPPLAPKIPLADESPSRPSGEPVFPEEGGTSGDEPASRGEPTEGGGNGRQAKEAGAAREPRFLDWWTHRIQ